MNIIWRPNPSTVPGDLCKPFSADRVHHGFPCPYSVAVENTAKRRQGVCRAQAPQTEGPGLCSQVSNTCSKCQHSLTGRLTFLWNWMRKSLSSCSIDEEYETNKDEVISPKLLIWMEINSLASGCSFFCQMEPLAMPTRHREYSCCIC